MSAFDYQIYDGDDGLSGKAGKAARLKAQNDIDAERIRQSQLAPQLPPPSMTIMPATPAPGAPAPAPGGDTASPGLLDTITGAFGDIPKPYLIGGAVLLGFFLLKKR